MKYKVNQKVLTPHGEATIKYIDYDSKTVRVKYKTPTTPITDFRFNQISIIKSKTF